MKNLKRCVALGISAAMLTLSVCSSVSAAEVDKSQKLIVYTNSGSNGRDEWLKSTAKDAGYNIEVVQIQGGDLSNRIISEKNNPQADMVFGLNAMEYEKLKNEEVIDKGPESLFGE